MNNHVRLETLGVLLHRRDILRERLALAWEAHRPTEFIRRIENDLWDTWERIDEAEALSERSRLVSSPSTCPAECV